MMKATKGDLADDIRGLLRRVDKSPELLLPSLEKLDYKDLDKLAVILEEVMKDA